MFISNRINTGSSKTFDQIVSEFLKKKESSIKTASVEAPVKVAEADEADSSGQLDVEPLHQVGESTNQDSINKDDGGSKSTSKKTESKDEEDSSGQPEAEAKLNNDPKVEATEKVEIKIAEDEDLEESDIDPESIKLIDKKDFVKEKEAGKKDEDKKDLEVEAKVEEEEEEEKEEVKKASSKKAYIKVANLTNESKSKLSVYWKKLYPAEFVDAMLADK